MKIIVCHSPDERCGVRQYGLALDRSLRAAGHEVFATDFGWVTGVNMSAQALLVHFEPGLISPELKVHFRQYLAQLRARETKVVFCCHYYDGRVGEEWADVVDSLVVHRAYPQPVPKGVEIPLGCPTYGGFPENRRPIRARFGLPQDRLVVTTVGFLTRWKRLPEVIDAVAACMPEGALVRAQTPWPSNVQGSGADREHEDLMRVAARWGPSKVQVDETFLPEIDLLDLVHASDMGFVYHPIDTGSVSAATKQFVSVRCPLVVTGSSHASDLRGTHRVGSLGIGDFAREVGHVAMNAGLRMHLRTQMQVEYQRINMDAVAARYIEVMR